MTFMNTTAAVLPCLARGFILATEQRTSCSSHPTMAGPSRVTGTHKKQRIGCTARFVRLILAQGASKPTQHRPNVYGRSREGTRGIHQEHVMVELGGTRTAHSQQPNGAPTNRCCRSSRCTVWSVAMLPHPAAKATAPYRAGLCFAGQSASDSATERLRCWTRNPLGSAPGQQQQRDSEHQDIVKMFKEGGTCQRGALVISKWQTKRHNACPSRISSPPRA